MLRPRIVRIRASTEVSFAALKISILMSTQIRES